MVIALLNTMDLMFGILFDERTEIVTASGTSIKI